MTLERLAEITNREKQGASFYERWPVAAYEDVRDLLADNASLRSELARVKEAAELLAAYAIDNALTDSRLGDDGTNPYCYLPDYIRYNPTAAALVEQSRKEKP